MKLIKRIFFDTDNNKIGHMTVYRKRNGNQYVVYFIEEKYKCFQEFSSFGFLVDGDKDIDFKVLNIQEYKF